MTATLPLPTLPLDRLTNDQKFELIHIIESSIEPTATPSPAGDFIVPAWHNDVLAQREKALADGTTNFIPLDEFIARSRRQAS